MKIPLKPYGKVSCRSISKRPNERGGARDLIGLTRMIEYKPNSEGSWDHSTP